MANVIPVKKSAAQVVIPVGVYEAVIEKYEQKKGNWGDYLQILFKIINGEHEGTIKSTVVSLKITDSPTKPSRLFTLIKNLGFEPNEEFDIDSIVGKKCRIMVTNGQMKDNIQYQDAEVLA